MNRVCSIEMKIEMKIRTALFIKSFKPERVFCMFDESEPHNFRFKEVKLPKMYTRSKDKSYCLFQVHFLTALKSQQLWFASHPEGGFHEFLSLAAVQVIRGTRSPFFRTPRLTALAVFPIHTTLILQTLSQLARA